MPGVWEGVRVRLAGDEDREGRKGRSDEGTGGVMELVKKGKKLQRTWSGACHKCGSQFRATQQELEDKNQITDDQRDGSFSQQKCAECGSEFFLYPDRATQR